MLHGEIKMNDVVIGEWTATHKATRGDFRDYTCTLWYRNAQGYIHEAEWQTWGHLTLDGPVTLAERVLKEGRHRAKRRKIDESQ